VRYNDLKEREDEVDLDIEYRKIEAGYEFVSAGPLHSHRALLDRATGVVLLQSESSGLDEFPEHIDADRHLFLPTRGELHLGKTLVVAFVKAHAPEALGEVLDMFGRKGAYQRFKEFLDRHKMVDQWYEFEEKETEKALRTWCGKMGISLTGGT
jgi:hypothetical protein